MTRLHEARFYQSCPDGSALCTLCPHDCHVPDGARGACGVRYNQGGKLYTLVYDRVVARELNPIEKKPFFHFLPGSYAYSISTVGCNLRCAFCQNWHISQWPKDHLAKEQGLKNNFVSNGFISEAPLRGLAAVLDAANIDLKFFKEESYRRVSRARLAPILDSHPD